MSGDAVLLDRAGTGDVAAFRELVEGHQEDVYRLALGLTGDHQGAEDLCQETFMRLHRSLTRFRGEAKLSSWLHRVAVNLHIDGQRLKWLRGLVLSSAMDELPDRTHDRDAGDAALDLGAALQALTARQRAVLVLKHYQGLKIREIAAELDIAEGTVKALLHQALQKLRRTLVDYDAEGI